ncbi:putative metallo-beta-lactamase-like protein [Actinoplanes missouriensis 431]|uniref:Putative metallo-beta-lactamase-like protein n=1 Tax=Actinoplanes missouriensis (strain ATCC 14538 / DSM 43046 / CBS 188.64 / JCM 3121 / NBRC 102363 / NCIMB 12654 / NRRL B-3342 / UNCC 431) TaxID=512565 RepID=I0H6N6_ACTM4|nr:MBL fold metallo-hydrolase [Actinoplanes missouriensis]BAL88673.1 putative metallo-beta-lactamase-like protein [Actinoplanes missouriensis 431]
MKLGPQLHRIGNDIVAVYLIVTDDGITVIDAGLSGQWPELISELDSLGRSVSDIRGVILTHGDTDHLGFAERLRRDHGVPVLVHTADAARARGEIKPKTSWGKIKVGALARFFWYASRKGGLKTTYVSEVTTIEDGQVLDLPGAPRIIGLPGHSPGSVAIHSAAADAVFVGDALTTRSVLTGENGPQPAPFTDDPAQAAVSLARIADLDVTWVLPGHGAPWNGGAAAIVRRIEEFRAA